MELIDHTPESVDIHLDRHELDTLLVLVEEGRLSLNRQEPTSQALDELLRTALAMMNHSNKQDATHH
ncbi:hypothetical protein F0M18_07785 [Pseudohalioglobus sediminis]|uniref:Uncharacterized protein n=1 Tax=Pseudohalioglobus sediminis TaxID=2606449 RepID=A0A5B0WZS7_9GAMM|nr:hypothetical protein [Pseudohalioglobus sediminis]KAA1192562.1 hypothetical protein F0M18_07785 [Pseudohalioglobus sediminis]